MAIVCFAAAHGASSNGGKWIFFLMAVHAFYCVFRADQRRHQIMAAAAGVIAPDLGSTT
jgi:hypothetical protein